MTKDEGKVWYLKQVHLFKGIPEEEVMKIASKMVEKKCSKKEVLYTPFDENNTVFFLKKGEVTLYHLYRGKKLIMDTLNAGSIFGNIHFEAKKHTHYAEVTQDAYICAFELEEFMEILRHRPELMLKLLREMSERLRTYEDKLKGGLFDAKEKIIHELERRDCTSPSLIDRLFGKDCKITHEKLAQLTGLSRETVTRGITALKKEGRIIDTVDGSIALRQEEGV